jgi:hypothetical protein
MMCLCEHGEYEWNESAECWQCNNCGDMQSGAGKEKIEAMQAVIRSITRIGDLPPILANPLIARHSARGVRTCENYCAAYSNASIASREWCEVHDHDLLGRSGNTVCDDAIERGEHYERFCGDCQTEHQASACPGCIGRAKFTGSEANDDTN